MAGLAELLGTTLVRNVQGETVEVAEILSEKTCVALYFSAHWCPPCKGFTPKLAEWYQKDLKAKGLEIVFVSSDQDESAFNDYFAEMPWLALPYSARDKKDELNKKFKVQGIPSVVVLGPDGKLITKDGRAAISGDPTGAELPWHPKSFDDIFSSVKLLGPGGSESLGSSLKGKVFGLYFSAHWCPPCRGFTPKLAEWYSKDLKDKGFEVVFVSSDRDEEAFKEYFAEQPWLALDFENRKAKEQLSNLFGVEGIPSLVIIDADGSVITKDGRSPITADPTGAEFPWYPKPVGNLKAGAGSINEVPTILAFCETSEAGAQKVMEEAIVPIAKKFKEESKANGKEDPDIAFIMVTSTESLSNRIRGMLEMTQLPSQPHEHPLEKKEPSGGWVCDGCGCRGGPDKDRHRCVQGCDFDFCGDCNTKVNSATPVTMPPRLMLVDIADNGGWYEGPEGDITTAVVEKFVSDYQTKALERKQLS